MDFEPTYMRIHLDGGDAHCYLIPMEPAPLILIAARKGFVMCGYLDLAVAEELGVAAAKVSGVSMFNDVLNAEIVDCTSLARKMGVSVGMRGKEALEMMS
ncbi:MAG: YunC family protein [Methermicoccaceae archaeon]